MGLKHGEVIKTAFDTYVVQRQRGSGGSGEVYEVVDSDGKRCAVKILDPAKTTSNRLKRFKNEINFCSTKSHKNIIKILGAGIKEPNAVFYVMPLYSHTLRDLIKGRIEPIQVLPLFSQILDGVEAAHLHGVWHRDLKPENILYSSTDDTIVVADFGIAHFEEADLLTDVETKDSDRLANFLYAAPEQRVRGQKVDDKADVYALGLMLHEMFLGEVPQGTGHRKIEDDIPNLAYLGQLIEQMRSQQPVGRPSIGEVKQELIARGNQFIAMQRLNAQRNEVVPETEINDPLVWDPIRLVAKDDYKNGTLILKLNQPVNKAWTDCFYNCATQVSNVSAANIRFDRDHANITAEEHWLEEAIRFLERYLTPANEDYAAQVRSNLVATIEARRIAIRSKIAHEETRLRILSKVKI